METIRQKQSRFARSFARLLDFATEQGYEVTWGEAWRPRLMVLLNSLTKAQATRLASVARGLVGLSPTQQGELAQLFMDAAGKGSFRSLHPDRLAVDLNLFKDGVWLTKTEDHRVLGEFWESLGADHRWGGRFGDGNHYSIEHQGRK